MKEEKRQAIISIGVVSLLTIFVILLITSFSLLILSGAKADYKLSERAANATSAFYKADALAEETLMSLYEIWLLNDESTLAAAFAKENFTVATPESENGLIVSYEIEIDEDKIFLAQIFFPFDKQDNIQRLKWQSSPKE